MGAGASWVRGGGAGLGGDPRQERNKGRERREEERVSRPISAFKVYTGDLEKHVEFFFRGDLLKPEIIKDSTMRVEELGYDSKSKMYFHAIRHLSSMTLKN